MSALLLAAVGGARRETGIALAANHLVAVELGSQGLEGGLNDTTTETEDQVEGRLLLDVVVRKSAAILELLAGEDQTLLVWGNACGRIKIRDTDENTDEIFQQLQPNGK